MATISLTTQGFKEKVFNYETEKDWKYQGELPAIIDFYAEWCIPCKKMKPELEELAKEQAATVEVYRIDVDDNPELAKQLEVSSLPVVMIYKGGEEKYSVTGYASKAELISQLGKLK